MKDFKRGKWNYDINKALEKAGLTPPYSPKKSRKNKKTS